MFQRMSRIGCVALAALLSIASIVAAGPTQDIVKHVPKTAWGYAVIRSVATIDKNIEQLETLGIPIPPGTRLAPMLQGPPLNLGDAMDAERPLCVVMLDVNRFGQANEQTPPDPQNAAALLMPIKDPKALIEKLAVAEASGGVRKIKLMEEELFAATKGDNYLVAGKSEKTVKEIASASGDGPAVGKGRSALLDSTDIYISISAEQLFTAYRPMIMPVLQMAMMQADPSAVQKIEKLLSELDSLDFGIRMDDSGLAVRGLVVPKKDSDLEMLIKDQKNADKTTLALLPKDNYLFAMGSASGYSDHSAKFGESNQISAMLQAAQLPNTDMAVAKSIDGEILKIQKSVKTSAFSLSAMPGGSQGYVGFAAVVETDKPAAMIESLRTIYKNIWQISDAPELKTAKTMLQHTPDAETVDGNKVDTITLKSKELAEEMEMTPEDVKMFKTLFGDDITIRFGAVGDKHVVMTFGGGKDRYAAASKLAKSGGESLADDKGVKAIGENLASPRSVEGFVSVENIMRLVKEVSKQMEGEDMIPYEVPEINAPAAFDSATVDGCTRFDLFIPMKLINAMKKAFDEQQKREMEAFDEIDDDAGDSGMGDDEGADSADDGSGSDDDE